MSLFELLIMVKILNGKNTIFLNQKTFESEIFILLIFR